MMKSFQRVLGLFAVVIAPVLFIGCGGPGAPISGASDPAEEAAAAPWLPRLGQLVLQVKRLKLIRQRKRPSPKWPLRLHPRIRRLPVPKNQRSKELSNRADYRFRRTQSN